MLLKHSFTEKDMAASKPLGETTILSLATPARESLRTTIPIGLVRQFGLNPGDTFNWKMKIEKGKLVIVVTPIRRDRRGVDKTHRQAH